MEELRRHWLQLVLMHASHSASRILWDAGGLPAGQVAWLFSHACGVRNDVGDFS